MERTCKDCKFDSVCVFEYADKRRNPEKCKSYEEKEILSNADYIRSLSDEELARFIRYIQDHVCECCVYYTEDFRCSTRNACSKEGHLLWLQQPRKVEE